MYRHLSSNGYYNNFTAVCSYFISGLRKQLIGTPLSLAG